MINIEEKLLRAYRQNDDVAFDAVIQELLNEGAFLPSALYSKVMKWLTANQKYSHEVRWGRFPLGMVQNLIERVERWEPKTIEERAAGPGEDDVGFDDPARKPSLEAENKRLLERVEELERKYADQCAGTWSREAQLAAANERIAGLEAENRTIRMQLPRFRRRGRDGGA